MDCPDCGEPMEKRTVPTNWQRSTSRWICQNPVCSVIFVEKRRDGKLTVARDPTMARITEVLEAK